MKIWSTYIPYRPIKKPTSQFDKEQLWARATFHLIQASLVRCVGWPFNLEIWSPPQSSFSRSPDDIASSCPPYIIGGSGLVLYTCGNIVKSYKKPLCQGELNWPCVYNAPPAWFMREARVAGKYRIIWNPPPPLGTPGFKTKQRFSEEKNLGWFQVYF